jgi:hypothetical protein
VERDELDTADKYMKENVVDVSVYIFVRDAWGVASV